MSISLREQFNKDGYAVMKELFTPEDVRLLKEEAGKIVGADGAGAGHTGVYVGLALASSLFRTTAAKPEMIEALKTIIGPHVIFLSDKLVFKNAAADFGSPWHQDYPYWEGSHKYSVWIALDNATPDNGCLRIVPGSHLAGDLHHGGDSSDGLGFINRLREEDIDPSQIVDLPASPGDAIIFHDLLFHSSYPNVSGLDRWALISTYKDGSLEDPAYPWAGAAFTVSG
ncbi:phytanoyl-CoA dioxygenase family protein [Paenibacillus nasutitermitis]|uniref:Phytanoyl-CoA dioxygenase family protein n=1 Tax=Paenibacillus nasutitermitis TaxID=1652958 RepID=A0A916ZHC2_9BACL|nr:phytanoyl-CoA dioxygenase family protein [Paenibacillus nasutitermitis]GGD96143.1 hypothetical protein GCM10010911_63520 [Paenibacillus nasutitermitis]